MIKMRPYLSLVLLVSLFACDANDESALSQAITDQAITESTIADVKINLVNQDSEVKAMDSSSYLLTIDLSILENQLAKGNVVVEAKVKNISNESVKLLPFNTPLDSSVLGKVFEVESGDQIEQELIQYVGIMAKRLPPVEEDYIQILPGQVVRQTLDITKSYKFCRNMSYTVSFARDIYDDSGVPMKFKAEKATFELMESLMQC